MSSKKLVFGVPQLKLKIASQGFIEKNFSFSLTIVSLDIRKLKSSNLGLMFLKFTAEHQETVFEISFLRFKIVLCDFY